MSCPEARLARGLCIVLLGGFCMVGTAHAESPARPAAVTAAAVPAAAASTAAEIQKINENMALLQARLNELDLRARIAARQKELGGSAPEPVQSSFDGRHGNPSVLAVAGLRGNLEATLVFPGGVVQRVRAGDVIDERRVHKVQLNEVVLTDLQGRHSQRLAFGNTPLTRERSALATPPAAPGVPVSGVPALLPNLPLPAAIGASAR